MRSWNSKHGRTLRRAAPFESARMPAKGVSGALTVQIFPALKSCSVHLVQCTCKRRGSRRLHNRHCGRAVPHASTTSGSAGYRAFSGRAGRSPVHWLCIGPPRGHCGAAPVTARRVNQSLRPSAPGAARCMPRARVSATALGETDHLPRLHESSQTTLLQNTAPGVAVGSLAAGSTKCSCCLGVPTGTRTCKSLPGTIS